MDFEDRYETIRDMRQIDPDTGKPKHTQKEVADELGLSRGRVTQLEKEMGFNPYMAALKSKDEPNPENSDTMTETETENENDESDEQVKPEIENQNSTTKVEENTEGEDWMCGSCGNNTFYDSKAYLNRFAERLTKEQLKAVRKGDKVCAACGVVSNE